MRPDTLEAIEIGSLEARAVRVVPEPNGSRRERPRAHEFALLPHDSLARIIPDLDGHPESAALQFPASHGQHRIAERKTAQYVSAARDRRKLQVGADGVVNEVEALGCQG